MNRKRNERDMCEGLGWDEEIDNLEDLHIPFNPTTKRERDERSANE